jgi:ferredoxin
VLIKVTDFHDFLGLCQSSKVGGYDKVFIPVNNDNSGEISFELLKPTSNIVLDKYRAQDPAKFLLYRFREAVSGKKFETKKYIIAGLKACDLKAILLLDKAMINEDFYDPAYKHWRNNTLFITSDCTELKDSCHCSLVDGKPYADSGYDINLTKINEKYFIKTGSEKGKSFVELLKSKFPVEQLTTEIESTIREQRTHLSELLIAQNQKYNRPKNYNVIQKAEQPAWTATSHECVGCGACTNICPTCYCLILNDESQMHEFVKVRSYDSCQLNGYARVAGGATPRPHMTERFRNRYLCKFCYIQSNFNQPGCTGCGRCIDACPAQIDFREVVHTISEHKDYSLKAKEQHVS